MRFELTQRQRQLMSLVAMGLSNKEIAANLNLSEFTVKNHIYRVMKQVDAQNRHEACPSDPRRRITRRPVANLACALAHPSDSATYPLVGAVSFILNFEGLRPALTSTRDNTSLPPLLHFRNRGPLAPVFHNIAHHFVSYNFGGVQRGKISLNDWSDSTARARRNNLCARRP